MWKHTDLMTPGPTSRDGHVAVLVVTDYATKWAMAMLWDRWICIFGIPEEIINDNESSQAKIS